jgi:hypothetical protein
MSKRGRRLERKFWDSIERREMRVEKQRNTFFGGGEKKRKKRSVERDKDLERRLRERKNRGTREKIIEEETEKKGTTTYLSRCRPKNRLETATRKVGAPPLSEQKETRGEEEQTKTDKEKEK